MSEKPTGFNWKAFFFAPYYYIGYGKTILGIIFLICSPLLGIFIAIYAGLKANKNLPVGEQPFNWRAVWLTIGVSLILGIAFVVLSDMNESTESDSEAEQAVQERSLSNVELFSQQHKNVAQQIELVKNHLKNVNCADAAGELEGLGETLIQQKKIIKRMSDQEKKAIQALASKGAILLQEMTYMADQACNEFEKAMIKEELDKIGRKATMVDYQ